MLRYIIVRTFWIFIVLVTFLSILFVTIRLLRVNTPTDTDAKALFYAKAEGDGYYTSKVVTEEEKNEIYKIYGNKYGYVNNNNKTWKVYIPVPISKQYVNFVKNVVTKWDWGTSTRIRPNVDVFDIIGERIPITMKLNFISLFIFIPLGFGLGILAALKKNKLTDNIISIGVMIFISVPSFVVMFLLLLLFGYTLRWLPTQFPPDYVKGAYVYKAMILPVMGLSFGSIAALSRSTRAELTEVLTSDFLLLARTKGLTRGQAVIRHALRNSLVPLVPGIIFSFVGLLSGSVIIERIYGITGMGDLYVQALAKGEFDYNLVVALSAIYTSISLFAILLVDLSYGIVDPRIRMGARK